MKIQGLLTLAAVLALPLTAQEASTPIVEPPAALESPALDALDASAEEEQAEAARRLARLLARRPYPPIEATAVPEPVGRDREIEEAVERFKETGDASILKRSDRILYPFDESQPVVTCSPLRACDVELQAGEVVTGVALGDSENWLAMPLTSGDRDKPIPHVILKPRVYDAATNLVIATDRRTYHLGLHSPEKEAVEGWELAYHRHVGFYYPADMVQQWVRLDELAKRRETAAAAAEVAIEASGALDLAALNFAYSTRPDRKATWNPTTVFDDGHHVYIELPRQAVIGELPALLVQTTDGQLGVANYRIQGRWYVVDTPFEKAVLVRGVGRHRREVAITNHAARAAG